MEVPDPHVHNRENSGIARGAGVARALNLHWILIAGSVAFLLSAAAPSAFAQRNLGRMGSEDLHVEPTERQALIPWCPENKAAR